MRVSNENRDSVKGVIEQDGVIIEELKWRWCTWYVFKAMESLPTDTTTEWA